MEIAIPLFENVTALDAIGPYEILQRLPGAEVVFVGVEKGEIRADSGSLGLTVDSTFNDVPAPEVVVVPGGPGTRTFTTGEPSALLEWISKVHMTTRYTTSVCTGSLLLAAAGLLQDMTATTHWGAYESLRKLGAEPTAERVVEHLDERIITAAGVSSGIDMALRLSELLFDADAAKAMQLLTEYDPQPPFDAGSVAKAGDAVMERLIEYTRLGKS